MHCECCGDGVLSPDEDCDDGNVANSDGCSSACEIENGWSCDTPAVNKVYTFESQTGPCITNPAEYPARNTFTTVPEGKYRVHYVSGCGSDQNASFSARVGYWYNGGGDTANWAGNNGPNGPTNAHWWNADTVASSTLAQCESSTNVSFGDINITGGTNNFGYGYIDSFCGDNPGPRTVANRISAMSSCVFVPDTDGDGVNDPDDSHPNDPMQCKDDDADSCDDCSVTQADGSGGSTTNDGTDTDSDGICDAGDTDDDNDGVSDGTDPNDTNPDICGDSDGDTCDDCSVGTDNFGAASDSIPGNDGLDTDSDGLCDLGDPDDDNDGIADGPDTDPTDPDICGDSDGDTCDDCSTGTDNFGSSSDSLPADDGVDTDSDGLCDAGDSDDDNDGVSDGTDPNDTNPDICGDSDTDTCDDCSVGTDNFGASSDSLPADDGPDADGDGLCDAGDNDDDNDGVANDDDPSPNNPDVCGDSDMDTCDDCSIGTDNLGPISDSLPANDGPDNDMDGICNDGEPDTDMDGIVDDDDIDDDNDGILDVDEGDGAVDTDGDGIFDSVDHDSDNDGILDWQEAGHAELDTTGDGEVDCAAGFGNNGFCDDLETAAESGMADYTIANTDGDAVGDWRDLDTDNDGISDLVEGGSGCTDAAPEDSECDGGYTGFGVATSATPITAPNNDGDTVPDFRDLDSDNDSLGDAAEGGSGCVDANQDRVCDGPDTDEDGIVDSVDDDDGVFGDPAVTATPNTDSTDGPDYLDTDNDNDGENEVDNALACADTDANGECDGMDTDGDGIIDVIDGNATFGAEPDWDLDGIPDATDIDDDNDGITDADEGDGAVDTDGDGVPDSRDLDTDNDGILDATEAGHDGLDANNDGRVDCAAGVGANGLCDSLETVADSGDTDYDSDGAGPDAVADTDSDTVGDWRDLDTDNDGISDLIEGGSGCTDAAATDSICDTPVDENGIATSATPIAPPNNDNDAAPDFRDLDSDNDGLSDVVEGASGCDDEDDNNVCDGPDADLDGIVDSVDDDDAAFGNPGAMSAPDADNTEGPDYLDTDSDGNGTNDVDDAPACEDVNPVDGQCDGPDTDGDGLVDAVDGDDVNFGSSPDTDGDGIVDGNDIDDDNDGILDVAEGDGTLDTDGDMIPDSLDLDADNDGLLDTQEAGHDDPDAELDGRTDCASGFGLNGFCDDLETAAESGQPDYNSDGAGPDMAVNTDMDGAPDFQDLDSDGDGLGDVVEGGSGCADAAATDAVCDGPVDANGIPTSATPGAPTNSDSDATPDWRDLDSDNDGIMDLTEIGSGCADADENAVCDGPDADNDGIADSIDDAPAVFGDPNGTEPTNTDGVDTPDYIDLDSDNDMTNDVEDVPACSDADTNGECDGADTDGDGIIETVDGYDGFGRLPPTDTDNDGIPDWTDIDDDNDGILDADEGDGAVDTDGDSVPDSLDLDVDNDGINDSVEAGHDRASATGVINCTAFGPNGFCDDLETAEDGVATFTIANIDGEGEGDWRDLDSDGDNIADVHEGSIGCTITKDKCDGVDADGDGIPDDIDNLMGHGAMAQAAPADTDGDTDPDWRDLDSDGDNIYDEDEAGDDDITTPPGDTDGDGDEDYRDLDSDDDGKSDEEEAGDSDPTTPPRDIDGDGVPDFQQVGRPALSGGAGCSSTSWPFGTVLGLLIAGLFFRRRESLI